MKSIRMSYNMQEHKDQEARQVPKENVERWAQVGRVDEMDHQVSPDSEVLQAPPVRVEPAGRQEPQADLEQMVRDLNEVRLVHPGLRDRVVGLATLDYKDHKVGSVFDHIHKINKLHSHVCLILRSLVNC